MTIRRILFFQTMLWMQYVEFTLSSSHFKGKEENYCTSWSRTYSINENLFASSSLVIYDVRVPGSFNTSWSKLIYNLCLEVRDVSVIFTVLNSWLVDIGKLIYASTQDICGANIVYQAWSNSTHRAKKQSAVGRYVVCLMHATPPNIENIYPCWS